MLLKDVSNVGQVDIPPVVFHHTVHDDVGHVPDFSPLLLKGVNQFYQDICVGCPHALTMTLPAVIFASRKAISVSASLWSLCGCTIMVTIT